MVRSPGGLLNRGQHRPWRLTSQFRAQLPQRFVLSPQVPMVVEGVYGYYKDEQKALSRNQRETILGPLFEDNHPVLTDGSFSSFLSAFNKRCNYHTNSRADPYIVKSGNKLLHQIVPNQLPEIEWTKDLFDEWVSQFDTHKRKRLVTALERLPAFSQREFSTKDVFEKVELLMKRHDPAWAGRIVNSSSDMHNSISGPIIALCLKRLVAAAEANYETSPKISFRVAYGASPQEFVSSMEGEGPFVEADFSSNDKMQVSDVSDLELRWSIRLGMPLWLAKVIKASNHYLVQSRKFGVRAKLRNQLPSGSTSTTYRNTIWNATIFYSWARRFGMRITSNILGDDMIARVLNGIIPKRARREYEHFAKLACMKAKVKVRQNLVDCEFLSRRFMPTCHGYLVVPKLGKSFGRFNARGNASDVSHSKYIAGKSLSYAYEFRHYHPLCEGFFERFMATGESFHKLDARLLSFSFNSAVKSAGSRSALLRQLATCPTASDDEFSQYVHYIYGKFRTEVMADFRHILFGDRDLSVESSAAYLLADVF